MSTLGRLLRAMKEEGMPKDDGSAAETDVPNPGE